METDHLRSWLVERFVLERSRDVKGGFFVTTSRLGGLHPSVLKGAVTREDASIQAVEEYSKLREVKKATGSPLGNLLSSFVSG